MDRDMKALAVVGDVHGDVGALRAMLDRLVGLDRHVVFVGDYVNGADDTALVLDLLSELGERDHTRWSFLAGNHDLALLDYLRDGDFGRFAALGGVAAISSYLTDVRGDVHTALVRAMPSRHFRFLNSLSACWESEEVLISHSGFCPDRPLDRSFEALARHGDWRVFTVSPPRPLVVCGHYSQRRWQPFVSDALICVDTGCGIAHGPLTAVLLPEREFLSVRRG